MIPLTSSLSVSHILSHSHPAFPCLHIIQPRMRSHRRPRRSCGSDSLGSPGQVRVCAYAATVRPDRGWGGRGEGHAGAATGDMLCDQVARGEDGHVPGRAQNDDITIDMIREQL